MTEREKARERARLMLAWAEEKTLQQLLLDHTWVDYIEEKLTVIYDPSCWRVKPEPRRKWETGYSETWSAEEAAEWRNKGETVTEWMEVLP